jgi:mono/diheme cytochrome c family protein
MTYRVILLTLLLVGAFTAGALSAASQTTPPHEDYDSGAYLYRTFCASCHGETGKGDGPVADLTDPRACDLTNLRRKAGGQFPRAYVVGVLDGTRPIAGHGAPAMPNWRSVLRRGAGNDERVVRARLEALATHVETLQVK